MRLKDELTPEYLAAFGVGLERCAAKGNEFCAAYWQRWQAMNEYERREMVLEIVDESNDVLQNMRELSLLIEDKQACSRRRALL